MIRMATFHDLPAIELFDTFSGSRSLEIKQSRCIVFVKNGDILGFGSWLPMGLLGSPLVTYLQVDKPYWRLKIAETLLQDMLVRFNGEKVFISTEENNEPMKALLDKNDWILSGVLTNANKDGVSERFYYKKTPN